MRWRILSMRDLARDRRGVAAIEFAFILPLLASLTLGGMQYGLLLFVQSNMYNAARDGTRSYITGSTTAAAASVAKGELPNWVQNASSLSVNVQDLGATVSTTITVSSAAAAIVSMVPMPARVSATVYMAK